MYCLSFSGIVVHVARESMHCTYLNPPVVYYIHTILTCTSRAGSSHCVYQQVQTLLSAVHYSLSKNNIRYDEVVMTFSLKIMEWALWCINVKFLQTNDFNSMLVLDNMLVKYSACDSYIEKSLKGVYTALNLVFSQAWRKPRQSPRAFEKQKKNPFSSLGFRAAHNGFNSFYKFVYQQVTLIWHIQ